MRKLYLLILCLVCSLSVSTVKAQGYLTKYVPTPLDSFLVDNVDTVFVFSYPHYKLGFHTTTAYLTKKGDTTTLFRYGAPLGDQYGMPTAISLEINKIHKVSKNRYVPADLNNFFLPVDLSRQNSKLLWSNLMALKPLQMSDDKVDGIACDRSDVLLGAPSHLPHTRLTMLTKNEVKHFHFYGAEYYEMTCPGRQGRITILKIEELFSQYINFNNPKFYLRR